MRPSRLALALPLALLLAGCGGGGDKVTQPPVTPPDNGFATSPTNLMQRLENTYESQSESGYVKLLAGDFRYVFSAASDPVLVNQYPNWDRDDEETSYKHLVHGFTNSGGTAIPAASRIDLTFNGVSYGPDPDHPDSTLQYQRVVVTIVDGSIEVPGDPDPVLYHISARHEFHVVRGDAGILASGAIADSTHWYLRRWDDLSTATASKFPVINPATPNSWGRIRSQYLN